MKPRPIRILAVALVTLATLAATPRLSDIIQGRDDGTPEYKALALRWTAFQVGLSNISAAVDNLNLAQTNLALAQARMEAARLNLLSVMQRYTVSWTNLTNALPTQ